MEKFSSIPDDSNDEVEFYITIKNVKKVSVSSSNIVDIETSSKADSLIMRISRNGTAKSTEDIIE